MFRSNPLAVICILAFLRINVISSGGGFPCRAESGPPEKQIVRRMMKRIVLFYQRNGPVFDPASCRGRMEPLARSGIGPDNGTATAGRTVGNGIGARFMIRSRVTEIRSTKRPALRKQVQYGTAGLSRLRDVLSRRFIHEH